MVYIFNIIHRKALDTGCRDRYSGTSKQNEEYHESSWSSIDKVHCCYIAKKIYKSWMRIHIGIYGSKGEVYSTTAVTAT